MSQSLFALQHVERVNVSTL